MTRRTTALLFTCAALSQAAVLDIPYTGGMQTGTFDLKGTSASGYPDTVVIDGGLRVIGFVEQPFRLCVGNYGYWMFLANTAGAVGVKSSQDTVWTGASAFPAGLALLDSISPVPDGVVPSQLVPPNLPGTARGVKVGAKSVGGLCYGTDFTAAQGHNRIVYFRLDHPAGTRYGKLMVHAREINRDTLPLTDGPRVELKRIQIAYTLSSSPDLNSGSVVGISLARAPSAITGGKLIWSERSGVSIRDPRRPGRLYDLTGKRRIVPDPAQ